MSQIGTREALVEMLTQKLVNLAHSHNFPLQQDIGLLSLEEGLRKLGADVKLNDKKREMNICFGFYSPHLEEGFTFETTAQYDHLLQGFGNFPIGSAASIRESSKVLFNLPKKEVPKKKPQMEWPGNLFKRSRFTEFDIPYSTKFRQGIWENKLDKMHEANISHINRTISNHIKARRENAFLSRTLHGEKEYQGSAIERLLDQHDLSYYERSKELYANRTNLPEDVLPFQLLAKNWNRFDEGLRFPSPETFEKFFWGLYLDKLQSLKGYSLSTQDYCDGPRKFLIIAQEKGLEKGKDITWGKDYVPT